MPTFTTRQKILRIVYPYWMALTKLFGKRSMILKNEKQIPPANSIYDLQIELSNGKLLPLNELKGKKILFVNTASDCAYTNQYEELQKLYRHTKEDLVIIGVPANDFKEQEKESDETIAQFCSRNFGVSFPLAKKAVVIKKAGQHAVYQWLTDKQKNGWNDQPPTWNFSKYLVDEKGVLTHYFDPSVSPISNEILQAVN